MNEIRRQAYLSALGIDNYMPGWQFANAPLARRCVMPASEDDPVGELLTLHNDVSFSTPRIIENDNLTGGQIHTPVAISSVFQTLIEDGIKPGGKPYPKSVVEKLLVPPEPAPKFSLSIWRAVDNWLIVDSRDPKSALPVHMLLSNIVEGMWSPSPFSDQEEIWHWPFTENSFASQTVEDAKAALSVWLEVEQEKRPIEHLMVMGEFAFLYTAFSDETYKDALWSRFSSDKGFDVLVFPSLVTLLRKPAEKRKVWQLLAGAAV